MIHYMPFLLDMSSAPKYLGPTRLCIPSRHSPIAPIVSIFAASKKKTLVKNKITRSQIRCSAICRTHRTHGYSIQTLRMCTRKEPWKLLSQNNSFGPEIKFLKKERSFLGLPNALLLFTLSLQLNF